MKLFDPFAGIKLATGHPLFHISFYLGSWMVEVFWDPSLWYSGTVEEYETNVANTETSQSM